MLETLERTQPGVASRLRADIQNGSLAPSLLFYGSAYSGKMTAAIDLAKALDHDRSEYETLSVSNIVILSDRDSRLRNDAALSLFARQNNFKSKRYLIKTLRIFLLRYHECMFQKGPLFEKAAELGELIAQIEETKDLTEKECEGYVTQLKSMLSAFYAAQSRSSIITIDEIRLIQAWLSARLPDTEKWVIIENIEDTTEGAKNSLLKLLEEPPEGAHLILVSTSCARMLPTILSRTRKYLFPPISQENAKRFLTDQFFAGGEHQNLKDFFFTEALGDNAKQINDSVHRFFFNALSSKMMGVTEKNTLCKLLDDASGYDYFYDLLAREVEEATLYRGLSAKKAKKILSSISFAANISSVYNQNRRNGLDWIERELLEYGK